MRLLSLYHLAAQASETFKRFYLPLLFAMAGSFTAVGMVSQEIEDNSFLIKLLFSCILALPFTVGATLYAERQARPKTVIFAIATIILILYGIFLAPDRFGQNDAATISFFVLCLVMHLWVAIAPYVRTDERLGFWKFNETLYVRMFISVIFSGALFAGLAVAILALDNLLQFPIDPKTYAQLWIVIAGIFNTWFFLSGVPKNFAELHTEKEFPKGLKIFTQYILIPLTTIYLVILYAYGGKILAIWDLPKGWVSMLIMCYAVIGILAVLLVYPLRHNEDKPWVKLFSRFFFIAMLPVTVLLFAAIGVRIRQYGITEPRYYLVALGVWLVAIAVYFIFSKQKNIKAIPATLIVLGICSLFGPWSAFSVSSASQHRILKTTLTDNKIWNNGKVLAHGEINDTIEKNTRELLWYFVDRNKEKELDPIFDLDVSALKDTVAQHLSDGYRVDSWAVNSATVDTLMDLLHLENNGAMVLSHIMRQRTFSSVSDNSFLNTEGYNNIFFYDRRESSANIWYNRDSLKLRFDDDRSMLTISDKSGALTQFAFKEAIKDLESDSINTSIPDYLMTIRGTGKTDAVFKITSISIFEDHSNSRIDNLKGYILMK